VSHNKKDRYGEAFQPGGTAILVINKWVHRATTLGDDQSRLGLGPFSSSPGLFYSVRVLSFQSGPLFIPVQAFYIEWGLFLERQSLPVKFGPTEKVQTINQSSVQTGDSMRGGPFIK